MATKKSEDRPVEQKLDAIIDLLRRSLALQLSKEGVPVIEIGKHLHVATGTVVKMLKGVRKEK